MICRTVNRTLKNKFIINFMIFVPVRMLVSLVYDHDAENKIQFSEMKFLRYLKECRVVDRIRNQDTKPPKKVKSH